MLKKLHLVLLIVSFFIISLSMSQEVLAVKYYYSKYNSTLVQTYADVAPWETGYFPNTTYVGRAKSYSFNTATNKYVLSTDVWKADEIVKAGDVAYWLLSDVNSIYRHVAYNGGFPASEVVNADVRYKIETKNTSTSSYTRGSLIQSNIIAEDGTYPVNNRHTDGYWYVRGSFVNTAPTTPTLTVPTTQFEHGDQHILSWNSTDTDGDALTYTLEASYNNGSTWTNLYSGSSKNYTYTVPTNQTQVNFRVRAYDGTAYSAYGTSANKTIREAMYYWSKYTVAKSNYYIESGWYIGDVYNGVGNFQSAHRSYTFNPSTGQFANSGGVFGSDNQPIGTVGYSAFGNTLYRSTIVGDAYIREDTKVGVLQSQDVAGSLIENNIQASFNAYLHNQRNPDGFWWVRGQRVLAGDITPPIIELTEQIEIARTSTVTVNTFDVSAVMVTKWAVGNQPISYFASGGINVTNNKFIALSNGVYTVYAKDAKGNEGLQTITVTKVNPFTVYTYDDANALISTSVGHSLLISSDQHVYSFGSNDVGQLGLGDTMDRHAPTKIESINNAVAVSAGQQSLVLTEDGEVYAFGYNASGQLGLGDSNNRNVPVKIPGISNAIAIDASETHSMILTEDGSVYTFGDNSFGQLGVKGVSERNVPTKVTGISNAVGISAGSYHSLVVTEDGAVYGFGFNYNGQLGLGNTTQQDTATKIPNISNAIGVSAGEMHSLVLTENGEVYAFGSNASGELGVGDTMDRFTPTKISSLHDVVSISASSEFSLFVTKNGEAYSTDLNGKDPIEPNLGKIPVKISTIENAVAINGGYAHLFVITEDRSVYSFGSNTYGQLGHGNTTKRLVPTKITAVQSAVIELDKINPTGFVTIDSTDWTNGHVGIVASGFDTGGSGFHAIKTPDGIVVKNSSTTYTVTENGTYSFVFKDRARNFVEKSVTVTHIDKTAPKIMFTPESRNADFKDIDVQISIADAGGSGLKHMRYAWSTEETKPTEGWSEWDTTSNLSLTQSQGGKWHLHIEAVDNTGNVAYVAGGPYEKIVVSGGPSVNINVFPLPTGQWVNQPIDVYIMDSGDAELLSKAKKYYEVTNSPLYPSQFSTVVPTDKKVQLNLQGENFIHIHYILDDGTKISSTSGPYLIDTGSVGTFEMKLVDSSGNEVSDWTNETLQLVMSNPSASSVSGINKQYRIEGLHTDWQPYVEGTTITVEGAYRIFGRIVSGTGTSSAQQVLNAKIDQTKPTTSSLKLVKNTNNTYDVRLKAADALSGVKEVVLNNGTKLTPNNNEYVISGLTAKPTSVSITDVAGNNSSSVAFATEPTIVFDAPYTLTTPLYRNDVVANLTNATGYLIGNRGFACTGEPCKVTLSQSGIFTAVRTDGVKETRVAIKIDNIDQSHLNLVLSGKRNSLSPKEMTFTWNYALTTGTLLCYEDGQSKLYAVSGKSFGLNGKNYLYSCSVSGDYKGVNLSSNTITVYPDSSLPSEGTGGVPGSDVTTNIYFQETMLGKSYLINAKTNNYTDNYVPIPENEITAN